MGQIKDGVYVCKRKDGKRRERAVAPRKEKPKISASKREAPKDRYSDDGFWTTRLPAATAFSLEWFRTHFFMIPYSWSMLKMALSVSKWSVFVVLFGTIARALVDAAKLYASTRLVSQVQNRLIKRADFKAQDSIANEEFGDFEKLLLLGLLPSLLRTLDRWLIQAM
jgi:hypothetical protein